MATTEAALCNVALLRVGQRQFIDALTDDTPQAKVCAVLYPHARDVVLVAFPWQFATRRAELAVVSGAERDGWEYVYAAPSGMAAPQYIWPGVADPEPEARIPFELEDGDTDATGQLILTDEEDAVLVYTTSELKLAQYPVDVQDAIAWRLAADLALGLPVKPAVAERLEAKYKSELAQAAARQLNRRQRPPPLDAESIRSR